MDMPQQRFRYPALEELCKLYPRRVELAIDTSSGDWLMELRVTTQDGNVMTRVPIQSVSDIGHAAKSLLT